MKHEVVVDELERYLMGSASREFLQHLESCDTCRAEVTAVEQVSLFLRDLRPEADSAPEPRPGFYNRVSGAIVEHQRKDAWGLFSPGALFFRRVAFASLLLLAGLGSFLVTREAGYDDVSGADAAAIMAQHDPGAPHFEGSDRDRMLVALANYKE